MHRISDSHGVSLHAIAAVHIRLNGYVGESYWFGIRKKARFGPSFVPGAFNFPKRVSASRHAGGRRF
ncbi:hypothetical protein HMPREF1155_0864 [Slackia sp. CM382]|nr:hypothetical protein HMPREF1155_0864 [Slackia sp. CM382]